MFIVYDIYISSLVEFILNKFQLSNTDKIINMLRLRSNKQSNILLIETTCMTVYLHIMLIILRK